MRRAGRPSSCATASTFCICTAIPGSAGWLTAGCCGSRSDYFGNFFQDLYRGSTFAKKLRPFLRKPAGDLLEWWYYAPLEKLFLEETREELLGVAEAAGLDGREALRGAVAPDLMEHLAAGFLAGGKEALGNYYLGGCSALYARGAALKDPAKAFFARNLDFPGALVWKHPVLIFSYPSEEVEALVEDGESFRWQRRPKQPYLYLSSAGFPGYGSRPSWRGRPAAACADLSGSCPGFSTTASWARCSSD